MLQRSQLYLLTAYTAHSQPVFRDFYLGRLVVQAMADQVQAGRVHTIAFVVMPDHVHWLVRMISPLSLTGLMRRFKGNATNRVNAARNQFGIPLWQRGYQSQAIREDVVRAWARHIVTEPLRTGLVRRLGDYPLWDSMWV